MVIGGVELPYEKGLLGHSDADVLLHAIADACLGALALGDIGKHFPDHDPAYKDADSRLLLGKVRDLIHNEGYHLGNLDCTVIAEKPKMSPYIDKMRTTIAELLHSDLSAVNVKATTGEKLGFVGREEGIAALAVVILQRKKP